MKFGLMILKSAGVYRTTELIRSGFFVDCSEYVKELPHKNVEKLSDVQSVPEDSKIWYTRENPTRHDTFISTSPDQQLHYQLYNEDTSNNISIETLDGTIKQTKKLNGQKSFEWVKKRFPKNPLKSEYILLEDRTRTLSDVRQLDGTVDRESVTSIVNSVQEEQIKAQRILEASKGE